MAKTLVEMDEEELMQTLNRVMSSVTAKEIAAIIRKMIEHSLQENGVKSND